MGFEDVHNVAKRELRFLVEASIKICLIQQQSWESSIQEAIARFDPELSSPSISIKPANQRAAPSATVRPPVPKETHRAERARSCGSSRPSHSPARRIALPMSSWGNQQDDTTLDKYRAGYDAKGSLLNMLERNVPAISGSEVRDGGDNP